MQDALLDLITGTGRALATPGQALSPASNRPLLLVILGPYAAAQAMLALSAQLALRGPLQVLDGGNRFNAYIVARELRRLSISAGTGPDLRQCLARIRVARAFTCYQMAALIDETCPGEARAGPGEARAGPGEARAGPGEARADQATDSTPLPSSPTLVIDLLDTFYDESAPLAERLRLAEQCMQRLRQAAPAGRREAVVVVSLRPPPPGQSDPTGLQELVQAGADQVLFLEGLEQEQDSQLRLF